MALVWRGSKPYYYKKRRVGDKVVSEYIGAGYSALVAEQITDTVRAEAEKKQREWQAIVDEQQRIDTMINDFSKLATAYADAMLLLTGHHQSKRKWRKQRGAK
jgi:ABC-type transport system involved in cytochrome bd biosynthesis fused ATPase/permease subunit